MNGEAYMAEECKWYCCCPVRFRTEKGELLRYWVETYCLGGKWRECVRYQKEEAGEYHSDRMLPDGSIS